LLGVLAGIGMAFYDLWRELSHDRRRRGRR